MSEKEFPRKAQSPLDGIGKDKYERVEKGVKPTAMTPLDEAGLNTLNPRLAPVRMQAYDALKPAAMTPVTGSGEDRGLKPNRMTPAPRTPEQPVSPPSHPKK